MRSVSGFCAAVMIVVSGAVVSGAVVSGAAMAQAPAAPAGPSGPAAEVQRSYTSLKGFIVKSAEKMPEDQYAVKPTPEVRTFARVVNHITEAQFRSCGIANGLTMKDIVKPPADTASKADVLAGLKASFVECDKAYSALTDTNLTEMFKLGPASRSRIGLMWGNVSHDNEQYATLAMYLRLKSLEPPSSEK